VSTVTVWRVLLLALALVLAPPAHAVQPDEILPDAALESRARVISRELRCMVCQNESIDESNAPLARDLRILVRERLVAGDSDRQVLDFLVRRYGDFVLLRPRFSWSTALLWATPVLALGIGAFVLYLGWSRRRSDPAPADVSPLSPEEQARLAALVAEDGKPRITNS